jgi:hypothetical protein
MAALKRIVAAAASDTIADELELPAAQQTVLLGCRTPCGATFLPKNCLQDW